MPTEQEVVDAIVSDEEVPKFIRGETEEIRALFDVARHRRGKQRVKAMDELQELVEAKLVSAYTSYHKIIGGLKITNMRHHQTIEELFFENEGLKARVVQLENGGDGSSEKS